MTDLNDQALAWLAADPDPSTRDELRALLDRSASDPAAEAELRDRFAGPLIFGTAGLRGAVGPGPNRMNRAVVLRAAHGLLRWLTDTVASDPVVAIGYDARYGSHQFALDTAAVTVAAGGRALLMPGPLPTPLLAFAVQYLGADAGVMVTASHNPKADNGYKVYLGNRSVPAEERGAQIVPPVDEQIAERIAAAPPAMNVPVADSGWDVLGEDLREAYLERIAQSVSAEPGTQPGPLRIALTPMHGVGGETVVRALARAGYRDVHLVPQQAEPDPEFPTIPFPNPEEAGAMDLAIEFAGSIQADLIIAVDPDADRCACAVPDVTAHSGWRQLTGDETGSLLGEQAARRLTRGGEVLQPENATLANSVVSSRLLASIARAHGVDHQVTLTGFKWIARASGLAFGYEEAIGFCVDPGGVRDKDGISASVRIAQLTDHLRQEGRTLLDALDDLAVQHGLHHTTQISVRVTDLSLIGQAMERLRQSPPAELAGSRVASVVDLAQGRPDLPPTDGMEFVTEAGDRVVVRPSGTEPKLKCYLEVIAPVEGGHPGVAQARRVALERMAQLRADVTAAIGM